MSKMKMMKHSIVSISLCLLVTFSEISCFVNMPCRKVNEPCSRNSDCCFEKCTFVWSSLGKYCLSNANTIFDDIQSLFAAKNQELCSIYKPTTEEEDKQINDKFGLNAGHALLPEYTKVEVTHNGKELLVTINNRKTNFTDVTTLELSKEAGKILDISEADGKTPCSIKVSVIENNVFMKLIYNLLPYIGIIFFLSLL